MDKRPRKQPKPPFPRAERERPPNYVGDHGTECTEQEVDAMAEDSFPASDPPSFTGTVTGSPRKKPANKNKQAK